MADEKLQTCAPSGRWGPSPVAKRVVRGRGGVAVPTTTHATVAFASTPAPAPSPPAQSPFRTLLSSPTGRWGPTPPRPKYEYKSPYKAFESKFDSWKPRGLTSPAGEPVAVPDPALPGYSFEVPSSRSGVGFRTGLDETTPTYSAGVPTPMSAGSYATVDSAFPSSGRKIVRIQRPKDYDRKTRQPVQKPQFDIHATKVVLLNTVSCSLIQEPKLHNPHDPTRIQILSLARKIASVDPEFILKLALYSRQDLNIRTTSNFLLAVASDNTGCRAFLRKYFSAAVNLPSDFLDVVALYMSLEERTTAGKALPSALRRALVDKFVQFDTYQLGKYKTKGKRKKDKAGKKGGKDKEEEGGADEDDNEEEGGGEGGDEGSGSGEEGPAAAAETGGRPDLKRAPEKPGVTMKHLIRLLHISKPVDHVMCILGKKYPSNGSEFAESGLPGDFEPERAGKRMKLPTPETWETQLSAKGNKASTWEELIDHKKLPFMAMLRNLRNLIVTGVSERHHRFVLDRLANENSVVNSRQFPFRFFSAYDAISGALDQVRRNVEAAKGGDAPAKRGRGRGARGARGGRGGRGGGAGRKRKVNLPANMPTQELINRYKAALDTAVKIATTHNCKPIHGYTVVLCDVCESVSDESKEAKKIGGSVRTVRELGVLLGLMCKFVSEDCDFRVYAEPGADGQTNVPIQLAEGTILDNMAVVMNQASNTLGTGTAFPFDFLEDLIRSKRKIDNLVVLSNKLIAAGHDEMTAYSATGTVGIAQFLHKYRQEVNPDLLFVSVDLAGRNVGVINEEDKHPNDVLVSGFSGSILSFIAERGDNNQLAFVEMIDEVKNLVGAKKIGGALSRKVMFKEAPRPAITTGGFSLAKAAPKEEEAPPILPEKAVQRARRPGEWGTVRVFISSTFLDMHGERDILARYVFPELRKRCERLRVNINEVDLRWGVTEAMTKDNTLVSVCLNEVDRCRPFFLGILGDRYGWVPPSYDLPDEPRFDWAKSYPSGRSVTELEMYYGVLQNPESSYGFFYLRDPAFNANIPKEHKTDFLCENREHALNLSNLKDRIRNECNYYTYQAEWAGVVDGKAQAGGPGLEDFAKRTLEDLWAAIQDLYPVDDTPEDPLVVEEGYHETVIESRSRCFVGRDQLLKHMTRFADGPHPGVLAVVGEAGAGKSALLAKFTRDYVIGLENKGDEQAYVLPHFVGAGPGSRDVRRMLIRICQEMSRRYGLSDPVPEDYVGVKQRFAQILKQVAHYGRVLLIIDAVNELDESNHAHLLDWIPSPVPVRIIISTTDGNCLAAIRRRNEGEAQEVALGELDFRERREIVRTLLWQYRKRLEEDPFNNQLKLLTGKRDAMHPLFLTVACEELRVFGVYDKLTDKLRRMAQSIPTLMAEVLQRLENEFGKALVSKALSLIACGRGGLLESELLVLLRREAERERELPRAIWASLYHGIETFLRPSGGGGEGTIDFFHNQFRDAVHERYLRSTDAAIAPHAQLADFFQALADPEGKNTWKGRNGRALAELPYHLIRAKAWPRLESVLCNLAFVEAKCDVGLVFDLVNDYNNAAALIPKDSAVLDDFSRFVSSNSHILRDHANLTYQQARNEPRTSHVAVHARGKGVVSAVSWIEWVNKPTYHDPCTMTLAGLSQAVTAVTVSPDGKYLVCASRDCSLKLYDAKTGTELSSLVGHKNWVTACAFSSDCTRIASASYDTTVKIWDVVKGMCIHTLEGHDGHARRVSDVAWSPDCRKVVSASWDTTLKLWNADTGKIIYTLSGHRGPVNTCSFSADNFWIVSGSWDNTLRVWNARRGKVEAVLEGHAKSVRGCTYSPDMKQIASVSVDGTLKLWSSVTGKEVGSFAGHSEAVNSVSFSADGSSLASGSDDHKVKVWSGHLGKELHTIQALPEGQGGVICVALADDGSRIAVGLADCTVRIYSSRTGKEECVLRGHTGTITAVAFSPHGGDTLVSASIDTTTKVWNIPDGSLVQSLGGHRASVTDVKFNPDGRTFITAGEDLVMIMWSVSELNEIRRFEGHTNFVKALSFAPDGRKFVSVGRDNRLMIWSVNSSKAEFQLDATKDWMNDVVWSGDNKYIVTASWDYNLTVWKVVPAGVEKHKVLQGHNQCVSSCSFSSDAALMVSSSYDGVVKVWDIEDAVELTSLQAHKARVNAVRFTASKMIITASDDGTVRTWNPLEGKEIATLTGHAGSVEGVVFMPDAAGNKLVSTSDDCSVKVWDVKESAETVEKHAAPVTALQFTHDGTALVSGSEDCHVKVWAVQDDNLVEDRTLRPLKRPVTAFALGNDGTVFAASHSTALTALHLGGEASDKMKKIHDNTVTAVALAPNEKLLATGAWDCRVNIVDAKNSNVKHSMEGHTDWVNHVAWSPDGRCIASGGCDNTVRIWNAKGGNLVVTCEGHTNWVKTVAWSPDGRFVASASYDGSVRLWDARNGAEVRCITEARKKTSEEESDAPEPVRAISLCFSGDGRFMVVGYGDHSLRLYDAATYSPREIGRFVAKGPVTVAAATVAGAAPAIACGDTLGNIYLLRVQS